MRTIIVIFSLFITFNIFSDTLIYDDLTIDKNSFLSLKIHNLNKKEMQTLSLFVDEKENKKFKSEKIKNNWLFGVIVDNSGSMLLNDFFTILERVRFLLSNVDKDDYLIVWKLNNTKEIIYPLSNPDETLGLKISSLIREGKFTRLYDGIIDAKKELKEIMKDPKYSKYNPYLLVFSDGDDIGSKSKAKEITERDNAIPFYFFSYINKEEKDIVIPFKNLADVTHGKILEKPSNDDINNLFIDRLNRYIIRFQINKEEILKREQYFIEIRTGNKFLKFDLRKLFGKNKNIDINKLDITTNNTISENIDSSNDYNNNIDKDSEATSDQKDDIIVDSSEDNINFNQTKDNSNDLTSDINRKGIIKVAGKNFSYLFLIIIALIILFLLLFIIIRKITNRAENRGNNADTSGSKTSGRKTFTDDFSFSNKNINETNNEKVKGNKDINRVKESEKSLKVNDNLSDDKYQDEKSDDNKKNLKEDIDNKVTEGSDDKEEFINKRKNEIKDILENRIGKKESNGIDRENENVNKESDQIEEGLIMGNNDLSESKEVFVMEKEDLNNIKKYNKISILHSDKPSFIDEPDHFGEEISINTNLKIKESDKDFIICLSDYPMLLDETVEINKIKLVSTKIIYNENKKNYRITFKPSKKIDLSSIFKVKQEISANKKTKIFGNRDAIIEKSLLSRDKFERKLIDSWQKGDLIYKKHKEAVLVTDYQLCIDTIVDIKEDDEIKSYFISKVTKIENERYKNKLHLLKNS